MNSADNLADNGNWRPAGQGSGGELSGFGEWNLGTSALSPMLLLLRRDLVRPGPSSAVGARVAARPRLAARSLTLTSHAAAFPPPPPPPSAVAAVSAAAAPGMKGVAAAAAEEAAAFDAVLSDISSLITGRKRSSTVNWVSDFESMKARAREGGGRVRLD